MQTFVAVDLETTGLRPKYDRILEIGALKVVNGELVETFGGSDNNSFAKNGIPGLVLSNGMYQAHSVNEYTTIKDLVTGAELIAGLITDEQ